jgi:phosphatidylethanolamine/phosphatidyl-N-methylethanolamine N-methyltransferase
VTTSSDLLAFLDAVSRRPRSVGAIAPSAPQLCRRLAQIVPRTHVSTVVELGAGTGAVSDAIGRRLAPGSRHLAIEIDPPLAERLRARRPDLEVVVGDASDLWDILRERGVDRVDAVVSGLPWSLFPAATQERILGAVAQVLAPGAGFATFAYLHALPLAGARGLRRLLDGTFDEVIASASVWRNLPPALTYTCRRPTWRAATWTTPCVPMAR